MPNTAIRSHADGLSEDAPRGQLRVPRWLVATMAVAILLTYFGMLGHFPLNEPDEPRYAEIAREMLVLHDWVTPHLNYVKYFEKPPLIYWLTAIDFRLFGMSEFVARLWPALCGVLGIVMAYAVGRSMYGAWTGCAAAALLATTPFYFGLSQALILDMPLSALMTIGLSAFWFAYTSRRHRQGFVLLLYAATALGVLTKGPVAAVLTGSIIVAFLLLRRELAALRWLLSPVGIGLFLVATLPWFVLVSGRNPEFLYFFIVKQHFARFLEPHEHQQGMWFFIPIVLGGMLPWSAFALLAPRTLREFVARLVRGRVSAAALYCALWSGVIFVFFSLSGSKLATYILPAFCPLAILGARFYQHVIEERRIHIMRRSALALLVFAAVALPAAVITAQVVDDWRVRPITSRVEVAALILAIAAAAVLYFVRGTARTRRVSGMHAAFVVLLFTMLAVQAVAISGRGVAREYRALGLAIRRQAAPEDLVVIYNHYVQGIPFYGRRRAVIVGGRGELDFGSRQGDQSAFFWKGDAELTAAWRSARHMFLVINRSELEPLRPQLVPAPRQVAAHGKKVIVVNFGAG